jgi:hypothetical protein
LASPPIASAHQLNLKRAYLPICGGVDRRGWAIRGTPPKQIGDGIARRFCTSPNAHAIPGAWCTCTIYRGPSRFKTEAISPPDQPFHGRMHLHLFTVQAYVPMVTKRLCRFCIWDIIIIRRLLGDDVMTFIQPDPQETRSRRIYITTGRPANDATVWSVP